MSNRHRRRDHLTGVLSRSAGGRGSRVRGERGQPGSWPWRAGPASALVSRPELRAVRGHLSAGMVVAATRAAVGTGLLLITGADVFRQLVLFLVEVGS